MFVQLKKCSVLMLLALVAATSALPGDYCCSGFGCDEGEVCDGGTGCGACKLKDGGFYWSCFPQSSVVTVLKELGPTSTVMKDLKVGDLVLTNRGVQDGPGVYEKVYAFGHRDPTITADFVEIVHADEMAKKPQHSLKATKDHLIYANGEYVPAGSIQVGDVLETPTGGNSTVHRIRTVRDQGLYSPFTASGTIIVDNTKASCYVSMQKEGLSGEFQVPGLPFAISNHQLLHMGASPIRMVCLGISSNFCENKIAIDPSSGYAKYAPVGMKVMELLGNENVPPVFHIFFFVVVAGLLAPFWMMECLFGASLAPSAIAALVGSIVWIRSKVTKKKKIE